MTNPWFRFHRKVVHNYKVQSLDHSLFRMWVNLMCLSDDNGKVPPIEEVCYALHETKEAVSSAFHELQKEALLETDGETFQIVGWGKKQYKSDTSTERVKRYRERKRNVSETPQKQTRTEADTESPIAPTEGEEQDLFKKPVSLKPKRTRKPVQEDSYFEEFKSAYPTRAGAQGWPEALRNFKKIVQSGTSPEKLIGAAQAYEKSTSDKEERQFIMQASSFLGPRKQAWKEYMNGTPVNGNGVSRGTRRVDAGTWDGRVEVFRDQGLWNPDWGPKPTEPGCYAPAEVLKQFQERVN